MNKTIFIVTSFLTLLLIPAIPVHAASKTVTIRTDASIQGTLELAISQSGQSELRFGNVVSSPTPTTEGPLTVDINVISNTGERYQVDQFLNEVLENENGDQIAIENLKFKTSSERSVGTVIATPISASAAAQTIFVSDSIGTSDLISAEYTLTTPAFQAPGNYSMSLTYTVSAL